ncbi:MAG TPA: LysE family transporter [Alphaproteobacteria bacterium]|nr:LysE family transporter [Alphaproteobacteria bacterium]
MHSELGAYLPVILGALAVHALGAMSPGPNFVIVSRHAIGRSRASALWATAGVQLGNAVYIALGLLGFIAVLQSFLWLYMALKVAGGLYLAWLGFCLWRDARKPLPAIDGAAAPVRHWKAFREGLFTNLSNVKAIAYFFSFFTLVFDPGMPLWAKLSTAAGMIVVSTVWYIAVTFVLSASGASAVYRRAKVWIDRIIGGVLGGLGLRLAATSF